MQYQSIVTLIDSYLERLSQVRQLLFETLQSPQVPEPHALRALIRGLPADAGKAEKATALRTERKRKANLVIPFMDAANGGVVSLAEVQAAGLKEAAPAHDLPAHEAAADASVSAKLSVRASFSRNLVQSRAPRRAPAQSKRASGANARALVPGVPTGPVYVSAAKVRQEQTERHHPITLEPAATAKPELTAEALAQRWGRSLAS